MGETEQLRELHDSYVWEVNAAIGEDRLDIVWRLVDDYTNEALVLITADDSYGCGRPDCAVCARAHVATAAPSRRRWHRRASRRRAA